MGSGSHDAACLETFVVLKPEKKVKSNPSKSSGYQKPHWCKHRKVGPSCLMKREVASVHGSQETKCQKLEDAWAASASAAEIEICALCAGFSKRR